VESVAPTLESQKVRPFSVPDCDDAPLDAKGQSGESAKCARKNCGSTIYGGLINSYVFSATSHAKRPPLCACLYGSSWDI